MASTVSNGNDRSEKWQRPFTKGKCAVTHIKEVPDAVDQPRFFIHHMASLDFRRLHTSIERYTSHNVCRAPYAVYSSAP